MQALKYRNDIDGLRAIAVLAVVLYHYGIGNLPGGFVGVDIFFVISGYLITGIIHKEIERGNFTFAGFYERRVRRIFPALFAMLLVTLVVGAWMLLPSDLIRLGNGALATLLFTSNVLFWRQSGYFDTGSEYNPLLHTWSLSVEEQFYIGLPILLILLHRFAKGGLKTALVVCAIVSLVLCVYVQPLRPTATFFLSPFRAWELLLGGCLAIGVVPPIRTARIRLLVSAAALALLLFSLWWIKAGPAFPGWQAMLPVIATAALLHAGAQGSSPVQRLLSLKPLVFVGLISYSLYLWHWPLIVFVRYRDGMAPLTPGVAWVMLGAALLLAAASYRWVETPFRRRASAAASEGQRRLFIAAAGPTVALMALSLLVGQYHGWHMRFSPEVVAMDDARQPAIPFVDCQQKIPTNTNPSCLAGRSGSSRRILLWGDSYALAWAPAFDALGRREDFAVELALLSSCPSLPGINVARKASCQVFNKEVLEYISSAAEDLHTIVLIGSWSAYLDPASGIQLDGADSADQKARSLEAGFRRVMEVAISKQIRLVIVGPTPGAPGDLPYKLAMSRVRGVTPPPGIGKEESYAYHQRFWDAVSTLGAGSSVAFVDPLPWFEQGERYQYLDEHGGLLYRDGGHLGLAGANFVAERFPLELLMPPHRATGHQAPADD